MTSTSNMAINVLVEHIVSIDCGLDYTAKINRPVTWNQLAKGQLDSLWTKDFIGAQRFIWFMSLIL